MFKKIIIWVVKIFINSKNLPDTKILDIKKLYKTLSHNYYQSISMELTYENVHAMLVEVVEEVGLLGLVDGGEHVFRVKKHSDDVCQLKT